MRDASAASAGSRRAGVFRIRPARDPARARVLAFDLDHTLARYDDDAVDALACAETWRRLVRAGVVPAWAPAPSWRPDAVVRGLFLDLDRARLVKPAPDGAAMRHDAGGVVAPGDGRPTRRAHPVGSPFDRVTAHLWRAAVAATGASPRPLLARVRRALDASHRGGDLKRRILAEPSRFLRPAGPAWRRATAPASPVEIVVTNSGPDYAVALLDHLLGRDVWSRRFAALVVDARKGDTFAARAPAPPERLTRIGSCRIVQGAGAAWIEQTFGTTPAEVAIAGDHPIHDLVAARRRGWVTVAVLPELEHGTEGPWGDPLRDGARATWLAAVAARCDAVVARVDDLVDPRAERVDPGSSAWPGRLPDGRLPAAGPRGAPHGASARA